MKLSLLTLILCFAGLLLPLLLQAQQRNGNGLTDEETYYFGVNPVAPFTGIRGDVTALYLPYIAQQEAGVALFIGKIWNRRYNVETRLSYGSPHNDYNLFQVHSGLNYCFPVNNSRWQPYAGVFVKLHLLHYREEETDRVSVIGYVDAGSRITWKKFFIDLRINENIAGIKWINEPGSKAKAGFHDSIYKFSSPYIPYASVGVGFFFN